MTAYNCEKQLAEKIVTTSLEIADNENFELKGYCEPFCDMLGVYRHIPVGFNEEGVHNIQYKAGDGNGSVIKMWEKALKGRFPPTNETKYTNVKDISNELKMVNFKHGSYEQFSDLIGYVIYCNPPYENCGHNSKSDNEQFWEWCDFMSASNIIFISCYEAPKGVNVVFTSDNISKQLYLM